MVDHILFIIRKQGERNAYSYVISFLYFSSGPQSMGWWHPHLVWLIPSWLKLSANALPHIAGLPPRHLQSCNGPPLSACFLHSIYQIVSKISSRLSTFWHKLVDISDWWAFDCYWTLFISDFESSFHFLILLRLYSFCLLKKKPNLVVIFCTISISPLLIFALNFVFNIWCSLLHLFVSSTS